MYSLEVEYCDFVVWSKTCIDIERIHVDQDFIKFNLDKASEFHKNVILPELLEDFILTQKIQLLRLGVIVVSPRMVRK